MIRHVFPDKHITAEGLNLFVQEWQRGAVAAEYVSAKPPAAGPRSRVGRGTLSALAGGDGDTSARDISFLRFLKDFGKTTFEIDEIANV